MGGLLKASLKLYLVAKHLSAELSKLLELDCESIYDFFGDRIS